MISSLTLGVPEKIRGAGANLIVNGLPIKIKFLSILVFSNIPLGNSTERVSAGKQILVPSHGLQEVFDSQMFFH